MYLSILSGLSPSFLANNYAKLSIENPQLSIDEEKIIFFFSAEK